MPRVIAGAARGRHLRAAAETRPTADLIKGAIFSMLEALAYKLGFSPSEDGDFAAAVAWPRVLDLFAGSGGLGIEALSRGARFAQFVEQDREAVRVLSANVRAAGVEDRARVHHAPVLLALPRVHGPIDVVFVDPPYGASSLLEEAVDALARPALLLPTSVAILEQSWDVPPPGRVADLPLATTRRHGRTRISLYAGAYPLPERVPSRVS